MNDKRIVIELWAHGTWKFYHEYTTVEDAQAATLLLKVAGQPYRVIEIVDEFRGGM